MLAVTLGDRPAPSSRRALPKVSVMDRLYLFSYFTNNTSSQHRGYRTGGGRGGEGGGRKERETVLAIART